MADVVRRVATGMSLDAGQYVQAAEQVAAANDKMARTGEHVAGAEEKVTRTTTVGAGAVERLQRQVDKAYGAQQSYARQIGIVDRALADGNITAARHAELVAKVEQNYRSHTERLNPTVSTWDRMGQGISRVNGYLAAFGVAISAISLVNLARNTLQYADDLETLADQLNLTITQAQAFRYAAAEADIRPQQAEQSLARFKQILGDAANGVKEAQGYFQGLGVSLVDLEGKTRPTAEILVEVARRLSSIEDPAERAGAAADFFGKIGSRLGPLLGELSQGFDTLTERASDAGQVMEEETVKALADANREIEKLGVQITIAAGTALAWITKLREATDELDVGTLTTELTNPDTLRRRLAEIDAALANFGVGAGSDEDPGATSLQLTTINTLLVERYRILRQIADLQRADAAVTNDALRLDRESGAVPGGVVYRPPRSGGGGTDKLPGELERLEKRLDPASAAIRQYQDDLKVLADAYNRDLIPTEERYLDLRKRLDDQFAQTSGAPARAIAKVEAQLKALENEARALEQGKDALDAYNRTKARADALQNFEDLVRRETAGLADQEVIVRRLTDRYVQLLDVKDQATLKAEALADAEEVASQQAEAAWQGITDLYDQIRTGSLTAQSALETIATTLLRIAELAAFGQEGFAGWAGNILNGLFSVGSAVVGAPQGGLSGGPRGYASGGAFDRRGEILTSPTLFRFASGGKMREGEAGEAGPEGILPLGRTASGDLGVKIAGGAGGGGGVVIGAINVTVETNDRDTPEDQGRRLGQSLRDELRGLVRSEMVQQQRDGGILRGGGGFT